MWNRGKPAGHTGTFDRRQRRTLSLGSAHALILAALAASRLLEAQYEVAPSGRPRFDRLITDTHLKPLRCTVNSWQPRLDFAFRFQAGYSVRFPVYQYEGEHNQIYLLTRVVPEGSSPVPLMQQFTLPKVPVKNHAWLAVDGAFLLGPGKYKVELLLADNSGRACRADWTMHTPRRAENLPVALSLPAGAVEPLTSRRWDEVPAPDPAAAKLTIFLDATPLNLRSTQLRPFDRILLVNSLISLLARVPHRDVRLVAFNLDQQKVIAEEDHLDEQGYRRLKNKLRDLQLATVDYKVLERRKGHVDLLARLMNAEIAAPERPDAIVFVGPASWLGDRFPPDRLERGSGSMPHVFYFEYHPYWGRGPEFPDVLRNLTKVCAGKVFAIHSPTELANALDTFTRALASSRLDSGRQGGIPSAAVSGP